LQDVDTRTLRLRRIDINWVEADGIWHMMIKKKPQLAEKLAEVNNQRLAK